MNICFFYSSSNVILGFLIFLSCFDYLAISVNMPFLSKHAPQIPSVPSEVTNQNKASNEQKKPSHSSNDK